MSVFFVTALYVFIWRNCNFLAHICALRCYEYHRCAHSASFPFSARFVSFWLTSNFSHLVASAPTQSTTMMLGNSFFCLSLTHHRYPHVSAQSEFLILPQIKYVPFFSFFVHENDLLRSFWTYTKWFRHIDINMSHFLSHGEVSGAQSTMDHSFLRGDIECGDMNLLSSHTSLPTGSMPGAGINVSLPFFWISRAQSIYICASKEEQFSYTHPTYAGYSHVCTLS